MPRRKSQSKWKVKTESVYVYGREERIKEAFEKILPEKTIYIKSKEVDNDDQANRALRKGFQQETNR